jgi:glucokinase
MFLGIEIGGTKLQLGVGPGDGTLAALWRATVDVAAGPEGIRRQITAGVPELLAKAGLERSRLQGVGIGFGGPVDDATRTIIKSHQIAGWDNFPLADWIGGIGRGAVWCRQRVVADLLHHHRQWHRRRPDNQRRNLPRLRPRSGGGWAPPI